MNDVVKMNDVFKSLMDLKMHADFMNQKPTRWAVGPNVIDLLPKELGMALDTPREGQFEYLGIPILLDDELPNGRVTLRCGKWHAGAFTLYPDQIRMDRMEAALKAIYRRQDRLESFDAEVNRLCKEGLGI